MRKTITGNESLNTLNFRQTINNNVKSVTFYNSQGVANAYFLIKNQAVIVSKTLDKDYTIVRDVVSNTMMSNVLSSLLATFMNKCSDTYDIVHNDCVVGVFTLNCVKNTIVLQNKRSYYWVMKEKHALSNNTSYIPDENTSALFSILGVDFKDIKTECMFTDNSYIEEILYPHTVARSYSMT
jgi:hypothetical protein